jgi:exodeoxyribonuclease-1
MYEYLLKMRDKTELKKLINLDNKQPFVYVSGRYDAEFNKATVAFPLTSGKNGNIVAYDLRYDPTPFLGMSTEALKKTMYATWEERQEDGFMKVPVKELQYNKVPAVAPVGVLAQADGWEKVQLDLATIEKHKSVLLTAPHFAENIRSVFEQRAEFKKSPDPEAQLYDGFVQDRDRLRIETVRNASARELADFHPEFTDERLNPLLLHYKARNFPQSLSQDESRAWEMWRAGHINARLPQFMQSLQKMAATEQNEEKQFVLQELHLWAESIIPGDMSDQDSED